MPREGGDPRESPDQIQHEPLRREETASAPARPSEAIAGSDPVAVRRNRSPLKTGVQFPENRFRSHQPGHDATFSGDDCRVTRSVLGHQRQRGAVAKLAQIFAHGQSHDRAQIITE